LPAQDAVKVKIGADARIVFDIAPDLAARAKVSFVAPEAQFTPKQVETRAERDKLMFRVKLAVPPERVLQYIERVKTGIRGIGYVRLDDAAEWPERLNRHLPEPSPPSAGVTSTEPAVSGSSGVSSALPPGVPPSQDKAATRPAADGSLPGPK
jgi:HlyD family secretion protein